MPHTSPPHRATFQWCGNGHLCLSRPEAAARNRIPHSYTGPPPPPREKQAGEARGTGGFFSPWLFLTHLVDLLLLIPQCLEPCKESWDLRKERCQSFCEVSRPAGAQVPVARPRLGQDAVWSPFLCILRVSVACTCARVCECRLKRKIPLNLLKT